MECRFGIVGPISSSPNPTSCTHCMSQYSARADQLGLQEVYVCTCMYNKHVSRYFVTVYMYCGCSCNKHVVMFAIARGFGNKV